MTVEIRFLFIRVASGLEAQSPLQNTGCALGFQAFVQKFQ